MQNCKNFYIGLCGAVHSGVARQIRNELTAHGDANTKIICVGDKSRAILQRLYGKNILMVANEVCIVLWLFNNFPAFKFLMLQYFNIYFV